MKRIKEMPDDAKKFIKRPMQVRAVQINEHFEVSTLEGVMTGQPGDWLMEGIDGELYICAYSIFQRSYEQVTI